MYGYYGKLLWIDLTNHKVSTEQVDPKTLRQYIGGVGLGARLLYDFAPQGVDPLSEDNPLIFVSSPFAGVVPEFSTKFAVSCKSPLTGFIGDSLSSGSLSTELKNTHFDALVLTGKANFLTYLVIRDVGVQFQNAERLKGLSAREVERNLKSEIGDPNLCVAAIGPAGEKLVRYACITNEGRQAGRTGAGAVMGSKNLKAIALKGTGSCPIAHSEELGGAIAIIEEARQGEGTAKYRDEGTVANLTAIDRLSALPSYNFRESTFEGAVNISADRLHRAHYTPNQNTSSTHEWEKVFATSGKNGERVKSRVEYESLFALGSLCGIDDPNAIIRAVAKCDELGIDTISTGGTIAWAMESFEKGALSTSDTDGVELRFGNAEALLSTIELIGRREGVGDLLADGSKRAAQLVEHGSESWAMQVKGLEMPGYHPKTLKALALGLAVSTRGACHNRSSAYDFDIAHIKEGADEKLEYGRLVADSEDFSALLDSLILSKFLRRSFTDFYGEVARIYGLITGWDTSPEELQQVGERINNARKLFNIREGWRREDDTLPDRILGEVNTSGESKDGSLSRDQLQSMITSYYQARGWTPEGLIPEDKLERLDLARYSEIPSQRT